MNRSKGKGRPKTTRKSWEAETIVTNDGHWTTNYAVALPRRELLRRMRAQAKR